MPSHPSHRTPSLFHALALAVALVAGCGRGERDVQVAEIGAGATLVLGAYLDGELHIRLEGVNTSGACPVLRDAHLLVNGVEVEPESRGGNDRHLYLPSKQLVPDVSNGCSEITASTYLDAAHTQAIDIALVDASGAIRTTVELPFVMPTLALAPGQAAEARAGTVVALTYAPSLHRASDFQVIGAFADGTYIRFEDQLKKTDGRFDIAITTAAVGVRSVYLAQPLIELSPSRCDGVTACELKVEGPDYLSEAPLTVLP